MSDEAGGDELVADAKRYFLETIPRSPRQYVINATEQFAYLFIGAALGVYFVGGELIAEFCRGFAIVPSPTCMGVTRTVNLYWGGAGLIGAVLFVLTNAIPEPDGEEGN